MSHEETSADLAGSEQAGYELTDVNPNSLVVFAITLFVALIIIIGASGLIFEMMREHADEANSEQQKNQLTGGNSIIPLGAPLQPSQADPRMDWQELQEMKAANDRIEDSLSTTSVPMPDGHSHMRIPVAWGMKLMAKDGLPENTATDIPVPVGTGVSGPTEYSPAYQDDGRDMVTH